MRRKTPQRSFPEEQNELAVKSDVRVRREESRPEERVRAIGRFLPQDVGERNKAETRGRDQGLRRIRPETEFAAVRTQRVPDVDREDPAGRENPVALRPRVGQHPEHPSIIGRS